jgi:hypothetical protein
MTFPGAAIAPLSASTVAAGGAVDSAPWTKISGEVLPCGCRRFDASAILVELQLVRQNDSGWIALSRDYDFQNFAVTMGESLQFHVELIRDAVFELDRVNHFRPRIIHRRA